MSDVSSLLTARERTHGAFSSNADAFDRLLTACPLEGFDPKERCAVAMIYMKLARLHTGQMRAEHWEDIAGYASLMLDVVAEQPKRQVDIGNYSGSPIQGTLR
jgi:hypothetical protein